MSQAHVDKAGMADVNELVELRLAYLREDNGCLDNDVEDAIQKGLPDYYRAHLGKDLTVFVARTNAEIVSCAFLLVVKKPMSPSFINGNTGIVLNVYTRPSHRNMGYAKQVMQALLDDARRLELCVLELKATDAGYPLYVSVGFCDDTSKYHPMRWDNQE